MFKWFAKKDKSSSLEKEIENVLEIMQYHQPESDEYTTMASNLERLHKAKALIPERKCPIPVETLLTVAGSLLGIVLILKYEETDSITSKAIGFIVRGRV